nr:hypothetical protein [Tanacetum cinerariifolium]
MIFDGMVKNFDIPVESHHIPTCASSTSQPYLLSPPRSSIRQETEVPQPSSPTHTHVADEAASTGVDVRHGGDATTVTRLNAGQGSDTARRNVQTYTRRRAVSTDSRGVSSASRMINTAKESVSTGGASKPVSTAGMIDKGKGIMEESDLDVTKTKRQQEQERLGIETAVRLQEEFDEEERQRMARVHEVAQTFTEEKYGNIRARVEADEELTQRLKAEERNKYNEFDQAKMLVDLINQRKRYFAEQKAKAKRKKTMTQAQQRTYISSKRDAEEKLDQGRSKKQKIGESSEPRNKDVNELSEEELQQSMIIVSEQGMNVKALQIKYPIIDWESYTEDTRKYWKIIRVGNHT